MIPVGNVNQIRECDRVTIEELGLPGLVLMENASRSVAFQIMEMLDGEIEGRRIVIFCGKGNNGGDGFALARHLKNHNAYPTVYLLGKVEDLKGDAEFNCKLYQKLDGEVQEITEKEQIIDLSVEADVIVDAMLGTGFTGELRGLYAEAGKIINESIVPVAAVDIPTGVEADSGLASENAIVADVTVTFGMIKRGLLVSPGREHAGDVIVADIGIPPEVEKQQNINLFIVEESDVFSALPLRGLNAHKGVAGHVYIIAGSPGLTGAAAMSGNAAMRAGAGLTVVGVPESLNHILEAKLDEVMTQPLPENFGHHLSYKAFDLAMTRIEWANCIVIGPGLGRDPDTAKLIDKIFDQKLDKPFVIDADGLNLLSDFPELMKKLPANTVLTPHPGEFSRLTNTPVKDILKSRFEIVEEYAKKWNAIIALKGAPTLTAIPDDGVYINPTGNPGMASGGTGDILTGIIAGFIAQGVPASIAAWMAVYLHGAAGDKAAEELNVYSLIAGDVLKYLPTILKNML